MAEGVPELSIQRWGSTGDKVLPGWLLTGVFELTEDANGRPNALLRPTTPKDTYLMPC